MRPSVIHRHIQSRSLPKRPLDDQEIPARGTAPKPSHLTGRFSTAQIGAMFAWLAVIIYAASNSIVTLLVDIGEANPVANGRNAITFTNLLFLGSLISLIPMIGMFRKDWTQDKLQQLAPRDWGVLTISAFLSSALTPGLFFIALEHSNVTNVVLIGRIEPPLFLLAAWVFLKERLDLRALIAGLIALSGAVVMIGLRETGGIEGIGIGELAAIAATLSFIVSTIVARQGLRNIPLGIFSIYRTVLGAVIYFTMVCILRGPEQFQDLFAPILLKWVWGYAFAVLVIGQFAWQIALKYARSGDVALATSFSPLAAIIIAVLLLGEDPGPGALPGATLILIAIAVGNMPKDFLRNGSHKLGHALMSLRDRTTHKALIARNSQGFARFV